MAEGTTQMLFRNLRVCPWNEEEKAEESTIHEGSEFPQDKKALLEIKAQPCHIHWTLDYSP